MRTAFVAIALGVLAFAPATSDAQGGNGRRGQGGLPPDRQIGEAIAEALQLTDQQRPKLADVSARFGPRQRALNEEEKNARISMRNLLCSGDTTRGTEMGRSLDLILDLQKRRLQLAEEEQHELSTFLTPYQRARFLGARERVDMAAGRGGGGGRGGRMGGPPPDQGGPPPGGRPPDGVRGQGRGGRGGPPPDICAAPPAGGPGQGRRGN